MKSNLLKLTSVLSMAAFMVITMFSTPAQADTLNANDVIVDATYEAPTMEDVDTYILVYKCFVLGCTIDEKSSSSKIEG